MKRKLVSSLVAVSSLSLGFVGMFGGVSSALKNPTVLTEETNVGVTFINNFNPVDSQSVSTQMATNALSYEPLIQYDSLKANVWYPWLATSETISPTGTVVTFTMNPKATWSNGQPLTAQHVANEFNELSSNATTNVFGIPTLARPATASGSKVTLTFSTPQFANVQALGGVLIFPVAADNIKGVAPSQYVTNGTQYMTASQVLGNGPYLPTRYDTQLITYTYNPNWHITPKPYVSAVNIPSYVANSGATTALAAHKLDWAGNDIPQAQQVFINSDPKHNHFYYPAGSTVTLWFNVSKGAPNGQTSCLGDPAFRNAISQAINRNELSRIGETGYEQPATSASGMTPTQSAYMGIYRNSYNLNGWSKQQVTTYLTAHGYALSNGYFQVSSATAQAATGLPAGTRCHFVIQDPASYTDYAEDASLISQELQDVGIDVGYTINNTGIWSANIYSRSFDAVVHWGAGGSNPYTQFENWLDDSPTTGGSTDYGQYQNAAAQSYLVQLAGLAPGTPAFQSVVNNLSAIMATDVPVAPILYGADWDAYTTSGFVGWVTPQDQYAYPGPGTNAVALIVTRLTKA